jgi:hypothetical protein
MVSHRRAISFPIMAQPTHTSHLSQRESLRRPSSSEACLRDSHGCLAHPKGQTLPTVLVLEEAHTFVRRGKDDDGPASSPTQLCCEVFKFERRLTL